MRIALSVMAAMTAVALLGGSPASAQVSIKLEEVAGDLTHPLVMTPFPDGSGRIAIVEQSGTIRILDEKGRVRPERSGQALGIKAGPGVWGSRGMPRVRPASGFANIACNAVQHAETGLSAPPPAPPGRSKKLKLARRRAGG